MTQRQGGVGLPQVSQGGPCFIATVNTASHPGPSAQAKVTGWVAGFAHLRTLQEPGLGGLLLDEASEQWDLMDLGLPRCFS